MQMLAFDTELANNGSEPSQLKTNTHKIIIEQQLYN